MTKPELAAILDKVQDDCRIVIVQKGGLVIDTALVYYMKAEKGFLAKDEIYIQVAQ